MATIAQLKTLRVAVSCAVSACVWGVGAQASSLSAAAALEEREVFVGESTLLQIQVSGTERPREPDLTALVDFTVQSVGGQRNSSQSVNIINGRVNRVVRYGYVFNYRITPKRAGHLIIPSLTVHAEGEQLKTQPISVLAKKPAETDQFKLQLSLSKSICYVGEPVVLSVTWYIGQDVKGFEFNLPVLEDARLAFADPEVQQRANRQYYRIPLGQGEVVAEKGRRRLEGLEYATIEFQKILIPTESGSIEIQPATVACEALVGYRRSRQGLTLFLGIFLTMIFSAEGEEVYTRRLLFHRTP